jgi:hypothetical protein
MYNPVLPIVPTVTFPPTTPFTDHVAAWFVLPVTVTLNCCACPTITVGAGGLTATTSRTASVSALELPPPGVGVVTTTPRLPPLANCVAGTTALNCVPLPYVVASAVLPNSTTDCTQKPVPVTVSVVFPLPAFTVAGEMLLTTGAGFTMLTDPVPDRVGSVTLAAWMSTTFGTGGTAGAVYNPVLSIVPTRAFPPTAPFTIHKTPALLPLTEAENWTCPLTNTCAVCGATET